VEPKFLILDKGSISQLGFQYGLPTATTDAASLPLPGFVLNAFNSSGLLLDEEQDLPKNGFDSNNPGAAPPGSAGIYWTVDYFATHAGTVAVEKASETALREVGFHVLRPVRLGFRGSAAEFDSIYQTGLGPTRGSPLDTQEWYAVSRNVFIDISDNGNFKLGTRQSAQLTIFKDIVKQIETRPTLILLLTPTLTLPEGGQAYLTAIAPVNKAEPVFMDKAQSWDATTTAAQAVADAHPLVVALANTERQVLTIASEYPPARTNLLETAGALEVLSADLLGRGQPTPGTSDWLQQYGKDLAALTTASDQARSKLGLPAAP